MRVDEETKRLKSSREKKEATHLCMNRIGEEGEASLLTSDPRPE